ncbi:nucleolar complex protein 2 homolog [Nilaparvata lugens]|uniref:nucleolar complex protein 2 homolog n=1 Tax=Nilaparvata lugens TaxID=108931 RepID=UPI00193D0AFF|nr:nucleolar complex protein 2 homolog [Nilaparvata lugens]XP_039277675.1 nucleolar complex protein 2 homolog [Nilaparvata lugens]
MKMKINKSVGKMKPSSLMKVKKKKLKKTAPKNNVAKKTAFHKAIRNGIPEAKQDSESENDSDEEMENEGDISETEMELSGGGHKKDLEKLKDTDPEFYKFLKENDKSVFDFDPEDSDNEDEEKVHRPPDSLEVNSDEEDYEADGQAAVASGSRKLVTLKMISEWQQQLSTDKSVNTISSVIKAFHAALQSVTKDTDEDSVPSEYKVVGSAVFNGVVQLCVLELQPALLRFLKISTEHGQLSRAQPAKSKNWKKLKLPLRDYFTDLLKLLGGVTSDHILCVMLKHLHQMTCFIAYYQQIIKQLLRRLVSMWSESSDETVRVLAFLCILRITTTQLKKWLEPVLKLMYSAYVSNSKFVSPNTLPGINFMRRCLTELLTLDAGVTYQHAFLYIRQLAIHLRNAITLHKKESIQAVYNWQFVNSLKLWTDTLCATHSKSQMQSLIYPLVQIIIGCVKLVPTTRYYPLRFHCCQMLIDLSRATATFIPVLPFILEVLTQTNFEKGHKKVSMKPMDFTCVLKLSQSQKLENAFKDATIEQVYRLTLLSLATESHRMSFPDLALLPILHLKNFVKTSKMSKYIQKLRGALNKIIENSKFIENERKKLTMNLNDTKAVEAWEKTILAKGTPLNTFCTSLMKIVAQQEAKNATDNDKLGHFKLPVLKKGEKKRNREDKEVRIPLSDSDDDEDESALLRMDGEPVQKKPKASKKTVNLEETRKKKKIKKNMTLKNAKDDDDDSVIDREDEIVDFDVNDF